MCIRDRYNELKTLEDKRAMVQMYLNGIDFCLSNDYPNNDYIRANFKGVMEEFGVFLDDNIDLVNVKKCVALGATKGRIEVNGFGVSEIFIKHESALNIIAKDNAFVMIDVFDDGVVMINAQDNAKILSLIHILTTIWHYSKKEGLKLLPMQNVKK